MSYLFQSVFKPKIPHFYRHLKRLQCRHFKLLFYRISLSVIKLLKYFTQIWLTRLNTSRWMGKLDHKQSQNPFPLQKNSLLIMNVKNNFAHWLYRKALTEKKTRILDYIKFGKQSQQLKSSCSYKPLFAEVAAFRNPLHNEQPLTERAPLTIKNLCNSVRTIFCDICIIYFISILYRETGNSNLFLEEMLLC